MALVADAVTLPEGLSIEPGGMRSGDIRARNTHAEADRLTLNVIGDAAPWVTVSPSVLALGPGEEGVARLFFRPPMSARVRAGDQPFAVRVRSELDPGRPLVANGSVRVEVFSDVGAEVAPQVTAGRRSAPLTVVVNNRGNAPVDATFRLDDPSGQLFLAAVPSPVQAAPGCRVPTDVVVQARRQRAYGPPAERPFTIVVEPEGLEPIRLPGRFRQEAAVSGRLVPVAGGILALVVVAAVLRLTVLAPSGSKPAVPAALGAPASGTAPSPAARAGRGTTPGQGSGTAGGSACPAGGHQAHDTNGQGTDTGLEPDNYSFLSLASGGCLPLRFNPCEPVHYVFNQVLATPADVADATQAIATIAKATGIDFVADGTTTQTVLGRRAAYDPAAYPGRWAPVLIEWSHLGTGNGTTEVAGRGAPSAVAGVYVSGVIDINVDTRFADGSPLPNGFGKGVTEGRIILHELGHLVGLGHVAGFDEIMHEPLTDQTARPSVFGVGDLTGLRLVGKSAGCLTTPPVPVAP